MKTTKKKKSVRYIYTVPYMKTEGVFEKVMGYDVEIFPWASTFVSKRITTWTVFEITTGKNVIGGKTIEEAISKAKAYLERMGEALTKQAIAGLPKAPEL
jgi:hypothetical protein